MIKRIFSGEDALGENVQSTVHSREGRSETRSGTEGGSTLHHEKRFKLVRMKDRCFQSAWFPEKCMRCGWLQGSSSCSATDSFQSQNIILSCDITVCMMKLPRCVWVPVAQSDQCLACPGCLEPQAAWEWGDLGSLCDFWRVSLVKSAGDTVTTTNTASSSSTTTLLQWAEGGEGEEINAKTPVSITGYGRCHFFSVISQKSQVETTYFSAGTRSARQRDNMSSDPVLMNSRWSVSASKVWNCPGRGIGTKLDFKQTSPLHTPWKRSKGKLHAKETDLRKPMRMKSCWCLLLLEERRDGQDHRAGQLWALDMGPSGCLAWTLWHQGSQSSSHKWFLPWSKHGTKWLSAFPASPAIQSFF